MTPIAQAVRSQGRGNDTMLVHMTPGEVRGLQALAMANGGSLTINPETGLPEAGFLSSILPMIAGVALNAFAPGLGTAVGSALGGVGAQVGTGLLVGGVTGLATGNLKKGLLAGLGAYGGAGLGQGLLNAGASQAGSVAPALGVKGAATGAGSQAAMLAEQMKGFGTEGLSSLAEAAKGAAGASPVMPSAIDLTKAGFGAAKAAPGEFFKDNLIPIAAAAAPLLLDEEEQQTTPVVTDKKRLDYRGGFKPGAATEEEIMAQRREFEDTYGIPYGLAGTSREVMHFPGFTYGKPEVVESAKGGAIKMAEGGDAEQYEYEFDNVTKTFKRKLKTPAEQIAAGKESKGAESGGYEAPTPTPGAGKSSGVPGKGIDLSGLKGLATALIPGMGLVNALQQGAMGALRGDGPSLGPGQGPGNGVGTPFGGMPAPAPTGGFTPADYASLADAFGPGTSTATSSSSSSADTEGGVADAFNTGGLTQAFKAGDKMENGSFIFPADALSDLGNGSSSAGLNAINKMLAKKGAPRAQMIRGKGDGQDDKIRSSIDGIQPALLSKEEAYISAAAVTRLGNGDAKKGAKKLYDMMRNVRRAAHGTTKQSRRVNPNKIATA